MEVGGLRTEKKKEKGPTNMVHTVTLSAHSVFFVNFSVIKELLKRF